ICHHTHSFNGKLLTKRISTNVPLQQDYTQDFCPLVPTYKATGYVPKLAPRTRPGIYVGMDSDLPILSFHLTTQPRPWGHASRAGRFSSQDKLRAPFG